MARYGRGHLANFRFPRSDTISGIEDADLVHADGFEFMDSRRAAPGIKKSPCAQRIQHALHTQPLGPESPLAVNPVRPQRARKVFQVLRALHIGQFLPGLSEEQRILLALLIREQILALEETLQMGFVPAP